MFYNNKVVLKNKVLTLLYKSSDYFKHNNTYFLILLEDYSPKIEFILNIVDFFLYLF